MTTVLPHKEFPTTQCRADTGLTSLQPNNHQQYKKTQGPQVSIIRDYMINTTLIAK